MSNYVIVGAQWGDEGKAKVIDYLTERSDIIVRFQGGANAGHTVMVDGEQFIFHLVPSGIMYPDKICVVGNGVVLDIEQFLVEIDELSAKNISVKDRLFVSDLAHLVLPFHKALDQASESRMGTLKIGTTGRGIGPAYSDKVLRQGIRAGDLRKWDTFTKKLNLLYINARDIIVNVYHKPFHLDCEEITENYRSIRERLLPMLADTARYIHEKSRAGNSVLFEGAQGTFLDIDHGTYPFVTSSNTIAGSVCTGAGIGPSLIGDVVGIVKTYTTRVGNGPFPTELGDSNGELLRAQGKEFGATTGRPRRCGWFDSVMLRKAIQLNGITLLAMTKLDVLNIFDEIKICTHYEIDGARTEDFPSDPGMLERALPIYESVPGWKQDIASARNFADLPAPAQTYIRRIQALCYDIPILIISIGPERTQTIEVKNR